MTSTSQPFGVTHARPLHRLHVTSGPADRDARLIAWAEEARTAGARVWSSAACFTTDSGLNLAGVSGGACDPVSLAAHMAETRRRMPLPEVHDLYGIAVVADLDDPAYQAGHHMTVLLSCLQGIICGRPEAGVMIAATCSDATAPAARLISRHGARVTRGARP
jgi:hypothetical protein